MDDLISRQAAIEYFMINTNWHDEEGYPIDDWDEKRKLLEDYFNGVPSAQQWIPVSERLPEDEGWYLVTDDSGGVRWLEVEHYDPEFGLEPFCTIQNPVAWMPLPEPYRKETEDERIHQD